MVTLRHKRYRLDNNDWWLITLPMMPKVLTNKEKTYEALCMCSAWFVQNVCGDQCPNVLAYQLAPDRWFPVTHYILQPWDCSANFGAYFLWFIWQSLTQSFGGDFHILQQSLDTILQQNPPYRYPGNAKIHLSTNPLDLAIATNLSRHWAWLHRGYWRYRNVIDN